jgi:hypothetical protein
MRFVTIQRRSGEAIPVNPAMVCYVRQAGNLSTISFANGNDIRVEVDAKLLAQAFAEAFDGDETELLKEPPRPGEPGAPPAEGAATAAGEAETADPPKDDDEDAKAQGRAQRAQEADPGEKPTPRHK